MKNTHTNIAPNFVSRFAKFTALFAAFAILCTNAPPGAQASIIFQDDTFDEVYSDAIQIGSNDAGAVNTAIRFGADASASENGNIIWNITTNRFSVDHAVDITGGLTSDAVVDIGGTLGLTGNSPASSRNLLRKDSAPNTNAACSALGEIIVNTTSNRVEVCTTTGIAGVAVWSAPTVSIPNFAADPGTCTVSDLYYNTTLNVLKICTATNVWTTVGPQDFEAVYNYDADKTLTTGGTAFTIATGGGALNHTLGSGEFDITSTGLIDFNAATFDVDTTGAITMDATGASNFTTTSGALTLSTVTTGAVNVTAADNVNVTSGAGDDITMVSGDDITFDDAQLTAPVQMTATATAFNATFATNAIIDNINSFTSTATGEGASNVGIEDVNNYFTGADVESALQQLGGAAAANTTELKFYPEYPDTVVYPDGATNAGTLVSERDNTNNRSYYQWTSNNGTTQDMDIRFRIVLPPDFSDVNDFTAEYQTGSVVVASNHVNFTVVNVTDSNTTCGTSIDNVSTTWAVATITEATIETGCTGGTALNAGDVVEIIVKYFDNSGAPDFARSGFVKLDYDNSI